MTLEGAELAAAIHCVACRVLPSGDTPGAREAHVVGYIEWLVRQRFFGPQRSKLQKGIAALDGLAMERFHRPFAECPAGQQDELLAMVSPAGPTDAGILLDLAIHVAIAGFLCSPRYGGNKDELGWRHVGFHPRRAADAA